MASLHAFCRGSRFIVCPRSIRVKAFPQRSCRTPVLYCAQEQRHRAAGKENGKYPCQK